jgi:hypothetical protein
MFFWLATICRTPSRDRTLTATFVILLGRLMALFTLRVDFALAWFPRALTPRHPARRMRASRECRYLRSG